MTRLPREFHLIISREVDEDIDQNMQIVESWCKKAGIYSHAHATSAGLPTVTAMMAGDGRHG